MDGFEAERTRASDRRSPPTVGERLFLLVYDELRRLAGRYLDAEDSPGSLQPTALVHEAYLRLAKLDRMRWNDRAHFFAVAATQMRRILIERARAAGAKKRGSRPRRVTLDSDLRSPEGGSPLEMLALDEALRRLEAVSPRQARIAEMRVFAGMEIEEIATVLSRSERTIKRDWRVARAWLSRELRRREGP